MDHGRDHHHRDEVRHVGDDLEGLPKRADADLVDQQRQDDGRRKAEHHAPDVDHEGVADDRSRVAGAEELLEVAQADPLAAERVEEVEPAERQYVAVHGDVLERQQEQDARKQHEQQVAVAHHALPEVAPAGEHVGGKRTITPSAAHGGGGFTHVRLADAAVCRCAASEGPAAAYDPAAARPSSSSSGRSGSGPRQDLLCLLVRRVLHFQQRVDVGIADLLYEIAPFA